MSITQMREELRNLSAQLETARARALSVAMDANADADTVRNATQEMTALRARVELLQGEITAAERQASGGATPVGSAEQRTLHDILSSREYARAFAAALRRGDRPRRDGVNDQNRILYDALTIAGGSPAGEDGGYLVPEDMDTSIREQMRAMQPLSAFVSVETVGSNTGWRVVDTAPTTGFTALTSEVPSGGVATDDQPAFGKVSFTLTTYGLRVPISNELMADETAGLMSYLSRWFAKKLALTHNKLILTEFDKLSAETITPGASDGATLALLKGVLNVALDPSISALATIITNQDGFNYLDGLADTTGRPLLQPDPATGAPMLFGSRRIAVCSNAILPTRESSGNYYPLYIGDGRQYTTLFQRAPMELASTDVGCDAWKSYSTEVRGIVRLGTGVFDSGAMCKREIFIGA